MEEKQMISDFFTNACMAKKINLPGEIIIHRAAYSPVEIAALKKKGVYGPIPAGELVCDLAVNGEVIGRGKIVKKAGDYYFKVIEIRA